MDSPSHTVLVVDDDASIRFLCRVNLEMEGWTVRDAATIDAHYAVNMRGTMLLSVEFARRFRGDSGGRIISLTSGQSLGPMPEELAYGATKGAIEAFTRSLAAAVSPMLAGALLAPAALVLIRSAGRAGRESCPSEQAAAEDRSDTDKTVVWSNWPEYIDLTEDFAEESEEYAQAAVEASAESRAVIEQERLDGNYFIPSFLNGDHSTKFGLRYRRTPVKVAPYESAGPLLSDVCHRRHPRGWHRRHRLPCPTSR